MNLSVSQIKKYDIQSGGCPRAYALEYVEDQKPPASPKQQFGKDVHSQLERWLRDAIAPDDTPEGQVAKQGIRKGWLPSPSSSLLVEHKFEIPWLEDVIMLGYIDCCEPVEIPLVLDHKTTSSLNWAMEAHELEDDPQALIYSLWAALEYQVSRVRARWLYYSASNPKRGPRRPTGALPVEIEFRTNSDEYINKIKRLIGVTKEMVHIRKEGILGKDCNINPQACNNYGGCWHRGKGCLLNPMDAAMSYF